MAYISPAQIITLSKQKNFHAHEHHQLVVGLKGAAKFEINGESNIILAGNVGIIPSHSLHSFSSSENAEILVLNFPKKFTHEASELRIKSLFINPGYYWIDTQIQRLIKLLVCEIESNLTDEFLGKACSDTILALLNRHVIAQHVDGKQKRINTYTINNFIAENIGKKITITQLANIAFLGNSQFYATFKHEFGLTPYQYILNKRIESARDMLRENHMSIGNIALQTGFSNQSAFSYAFVKYKGCSPSQYRHSHLNRD